MIVLPIWSHQHVDLVDCLPLAICKTVGVNCLQCHGVNAHATGICAGITHASVPRSTHTKHYL